MTETEMVEVLHVFIPTILFQILLNMFYFEIIIPKVKSIANGIFDRTLNANDFLNTFSNNFIDKTNDIYLSETLISTYFEMENSFSKKFSHINIRTPYLSQQTNIRIFVKHFH